MLPFIPRRFTRLAYFSVSLLVLASLLLVFKNVFHPPKEYKVGVIVSSTQSNQATIELIKLFVDKRIDEFNRKGGIGGHPVKAVYMDDHQDSSLTRKHVANIITDTHLLGIIGCWNSTRGKEIVDLIGESGVPFIGDFSLDTLFSNYGNIYSMTKGISDRLFVFDRFIKSRMVKNIAFIGETGDLYTTEYYNHIRNHLSDDDLGLTYEKWLPKSKKVDEGTLKNIVSGVKESEVDMIFLSLDTSRNSIIVESLRENNLKIPVYTILGTIGGLLSEIGHDFDFDWYDTAEKGVPNVESQRLEELVTRYSSDISEIDSGRYVVGYGARYADGVGMILDSAKNTRSRDIGDIRKHVIGSLRDYVSGKHVYKGWSRYWAFTKNRTSSEDVLLVWKPANYDGFILYPEQYMREGGEHKRKPVIYLSVDMIRIAGVDNSEKSFYAEFYLNIKSTDPKVDGSYIEFTNAYRGESANEALIDIREINEDIGTDNNEGQLRSNHLYKISGKFDFYPDLRLYPFDEQKFSISFQPKNAKHGFLIQPPKLELRDMDFSTDGWFIKTHYVGMDRNIIRSIKGFVSEGVITPFYKFNYTWVMERSKADYFIKTIIPLIIILIITYFSIYMRQVDFGTTVNIQITTLLASIALYFSIYKPVTDYATLSDKIFLFTYFSIMYMMTISIFKSIYHVEDSGRLISAIDLMQKYIFPLLVLSMVGYVLFVKYLSE
uniref:ABC-type branched-chain amino acid transport system, substrate-binding protein n=1 Tax=Candidatus Kentrum sp. FW TaxID=2126338 RepID=A0A450TTW2_9GAMM|nr:MAG: ABC-type branched-chain amino acid transport system, substrate-binding protein [Candidatus Kentron sp. FW]